MNRLAATLVFLLLLACAALAKNRHCMFRVHAEANPEDTEVFSRSVQAQLSGKQVSIERVARITEQDVQGFYPYPLGNGQFGVLFQLDDHGRVALDALSIERRGRFLFIFINGRAITELQIDKRVTDGQLYIASGLTAADIEVMKRDWRLIGQRRK
ncbi:MAG TPA: hypothetical protein VGM62_00405 [Chthoniobacterales bacterium]|jgi:hypothetical protein